MPRRISIQHAAVLTFLALGAGCATTHIAPYTPRHRTYKSPVNFAAQAKPASNGAIFAAGMPGTYLFADQRAMRVGDIVTVRIVEQANAKRAATTALSRKSDTELKIGAFLGLISKLQKVLGTKDGSLLSAGTTTDFTGKGTTTRTENLTATVPATVLQVLPNGNLYVEGHRVILVNNEEHHFYISGVVRPVDIQGDNSVLSSQIADAEIEFTGRGVVSEQQQPPWLQRGLDIGRPF